MSKAVKNWLKYGITALVCLLIGVSYLTTREYTDGTMAIAIEKLFEGTIALEAKKELIRFCCDALFVPGVLVTLLGLLIAVANEGAFYGVGYLMSNLGKMLIPGGRMRTETYGDYLERKSGKKTTGYGFLFIVGVIFMLLSMIFYGWFYSL